MGVDVMQATGRSCGCVIIVATSSSTTGESHPRCHSCGGLVTWASSGVTMVVNEPEDAFDRAIRELAEIAKTAKRTTKQRPCKRHKVVACQAPCCR